MYSKPIFHATTWNIEIFTIKNRDTVVGALQQKKEIIQIKLVLIKPFYVLGYS